MSVDRPSIAIPTTTPERRAAARLQLILMLAERAVREVLAEQTGSVAVSQPAIAESAEVVAAAGGSGSGIA